MRPVLPALLLLSLSAVACGGTDEGRFEYDVGEEVKFDRCKADKGYEFFSLVDFEPHQAGGGQLSRQVRCNPELSDTDQAPCSFYFNYDEASSPPNPSASPSRPRGDDCVALAVDEDAVVYSHPGIGKQSFDSQEIEGGRCGKDGSALNIVTKNVGMCYGANGRLGWGAGLDIAFMPPLDASEWDGISFWVKNSPKGEKPAIIIQFVDPYTSGGGCDASDPQPGQGMVPDFEKCDNFGTAVTLTDDWTFVPALFSDLAQKGFGVVSPVGHLKTDEIVRMQIFMNAGSADFWVDDIALFRNTK